MKRFMVATCVLAVVGLAAATAQAGIETITFNGSDIVAPVLATNPNVTPVVGDGYISFTSGSVIRTYTVPGDPAPNPAAFNSWLGSLGTGQGISGFNLWLQDGLSDQAAIWGETIALTNPQGPASAITPFVSAGWTATVYTVGAEWGAPWEGSTLISFTANSSADYLRPGTTAQFGFTADVTGFDGGTGPTYQMWVGAGDAAESDTGADQLAGVSDGVYFQRAVTATAVPEPASIVVWSLLGSLGVTLGWYRRKRAA